MNFQSKKTMPRYFLVSVLLAFAGVCGFCKAIYTMTADRETWEKMSSLLVKEDRELPAVRGNILASDGQILAAELPEYQVFLDFMSYEKDSLMREKDQARRDALLSDSVLDLACAGMHKLFPDIDPAKLKAHIREGRKAKSHCWPVYTADVSSGKFRKGENRQITYIEYSAVKELPLFNVKSSVNYQKHERRKRPFGNLAIRTIGDFKDTARFGLELTFDSVLAGKSGKFHFQKVMNRKIPVIDVPAEDGCDIVTTLDVNMQQVCEQALKDKLVELNESGSAESGVCILMEVATGDIKAMTSLSRQADGSFAEERALAVTDLYEPGSVFKPQSFLVAFDDKKIKLTDQVNVGGGIYNFGSRKMRDHNWRSGGYGTITVPQIIGKSSNVGVSVLINNAYHDNPRAFVDGLYRIGSAEDLQIPLPGYEKPRIRRPGEGAYWSATTLPWMSIGYETQITPINTLNFYNGIANNGKLLRPRLVKAIKRGDEVVKEFPVTVLREHMASDEAIRNVQECLEYVTTLGVGKAANSKLFNVAGKTGTAQVWTGKGRSADYFITFAGYFPVESPKYSCIVCIRKSGAASGGGMCGPVFRRVAETIMATNHSDDYTTARDTLHATAAVECEGNIGVVSNLLSALGITTSNVPAGGATTWGSVSVGGRTANATAATRSETIVPDVIGYGLRDAVSRLEALGLKVQSKGAGRVTAQSLPYGHTIKRGETIVLTLGHSKATHTTAAPPESKEQANQSTESKPDSTKVKAESTDKKPQAKSQEEKKPTKKAEDKKATTEKKSEKKTEKKTEKKSEKSTSKSEKSEKKSEKKTEKKAEVKKETKKDKKSTSKTDKKSAAVTSKKEKKSKG